VAETSTDGGDGGRPGLLWPSLGVGAALGAVVLGGVLPHLPVEGFVDSEVNDVYVAVMVPAHAVGLLVTRRLRSRGLDLGEPLFNALFALMGTVAAVRGLGWAPGVDVDWSSVQVLTWVAAVLVWALVLVRTGDGLSVPN
jgi:hypothetical protein